MSSFRKAFSSPVVEVFSCLVERENAQRVYQPKLVISAKVFVSLDKDESDLQSLFAARSS